MKKIISLALALAMTVALVPATAFAATDMKVSRTVTGEADDELTTNAPILTLEADGDFKDAVQDFEIQLTNAEWAEKANGTLKVIGKAKFHGKAGVVGTVKITKKTSKAIYVNVVLDGDKKIKDGNYIDIPLLTELKGDGNATVTVNAKDSEFTSETKTFAKIAEGSTKTYIDGTTNFQDGEVIDPIFIEEVTTDTFKAGELTVKLNGGFKFKEMKAKVIGESPAKVTLTGLEDKVKVASEDIDDETVTLHVKGGKTTKVATIKLYDIVIAEDGADFGDVARITVNGAGVTRETVEVGAYVDFGVSLTAAKKDVPVIYAGTAVENDDNETLKVTLKETVTGSWLVNRKTVLTLPEGVKFADVEVNKAKNLIDKDAKTQNAGAVETILAEGADGNEITIDAKDIGVKPGEKAEIEMTFDVIAAPDFAGDVELKVSGPGVSNEELKATIATVKAPFTVKAATNEVKIDYRNVTVGDIVITEPAVGVWEKDQTITLKVEEMQFEKGIIAKVTAGDVNLDKLDGDNVKVNKKAGTVELQIKSASAKTPGEITISGVQLYLERSLPAGDYELQAVVSDADRKFEKDELKDILFENYAYDADVNDDKYDFVKNKRAFDVDSVTVLKDYVKVVTAGRDMNDTFTTKITVPVGKDTILAGTKEIKVDAAAYINKDGYTMLPVRAVTEALNGLAIVRWDDATKTATISFGSRVFAMTVNSKTMNMNGVPTTLLAAPEIKNSRIFLPLRDLGYALGLTDSKITWDAATATATLN